MWAVAAEPRLQMTKLVFGFAVRLALLGACYLIASATQVNHLLYSLLKGNYSRYQILFYCSVFCISLVAAPLHRALPRKQILLPLSPVLGYVSGLVALFLMPWRFGLRRIFSLRDIDAGFFWSPILTFQWLVGFYFVLLIMFFTPTHSGQELP